MKIRTDFVTNSSSSSFITIIATKKDGTIITDKLESDGYPDKLIYFSSGIKKIVCAKTANGEEILKNIQKMYRNSRIDYLLDESGEEHPLRGIKSLKDLLKVNIKEEIYGDILDGIDCYDSKGEFAHPESATVEFSYDVEKEVYSKKKCFAVSEDGETLEVSEEY